jgi:hypothetical protein
MKNFKVYLSTDTDSESENLVLLAIIPARSKESALCQVVNRGYKLHELHAQAD